MKAEKLMLLPRTSWNHFSCRLDNGPERCMVLTAETRMVKGCAYVIT